MTELEGAISKEYFAAQRGVAMRAGQGLGYLRISGKDHVDLLHRLTTNDLRPLQPGHGQLNIFTNDKGRIIDRVALLRFPEEVHLMTSAGNGPTLAKWLNDYIFVEDVAVKDASADVCILSAWGAKVPALLHTVLNIQIESLTAWHFQEIEWQSHRLVVQRSEELTVPGCNIIIPSAGGKLLRQRLATVPQLRPVVMSDQTYDILRIESGWQAFGKDFDNHVNPHEAGLVSLVSYDKGCFIGQEVIARLDTYEKVKKRLLGLVVEGEIPVKPGAAIIIGNEEIGCVTSAAFSIALGKHAGLCHVKTKVAIAGTEVMVALDGMMLSARLAALPLTGSHDDSTAAHTHSPTSI